MRRIFIVLLAFFLVPYVYAHEDYKFPDYTYNACSASTVGFKSFKNLEVLDMGFARLLYNPKTVEAVRDKNATYVEGSFFHFDEKSFNSDAGTIVLAKIKLHAQDKHYYSLEFSRGYSGDPAFFLISQDTEYSSFEYLSGREIVVPGNGYVYIAGRENFDFYTRRKYKVEKNQLTEVKQPFYYVGSITTAMKPITLLQEKNDNSIVAKLPAGYEVEVLLADYTETKESDNRVRWYLVRTSFGLVGWVKSKSGPFCKESLIEGICYCGD